jgi:hypothetical protein
MAKLHQRKATIVERYLMMLSMIKHQLNFWPQTFGEMARVLRECTSRLPNIQWPHLLLAPASLLFERGRAEPECLLWVMGGRADRVLGTGRRRPVDPGKLTRSGSAGR